MGRRELDRIDRTASRGGPSEPVQYYVAVPGLAGADLALLAARGAVLGHLRFRGHPGYLKWWRGSMAKVVLRAEAAEIAGLARAHDGLTIPEPPDVPSLAVFRPRPKGRATFVGHLKLYSGRIGRTALAEWPAPGVRVPILVNGDLDLSAGKLAAQAAHAVLALLERRERSASWDDWLQAGLPFALVRVPGSTLARLVDEGRAFGVEDEGRTEIPRGSLTAAAAEPGTLWLFSGQAGFDLLAVADGRPVGVRSDAR